MQSELDVRGRTEPRLWTPPLRELTPETSYGFDVIDFARDVLETPLDPWQEWLVIHAGELLEDGRPRFRTVLALCARQQGKTFLLQVLTLFWLYRQRVPLVLGTSTTRERAKDAWRAVVAAAQANEQLAAEIENVRLQISEEQLTTVHGSAYRFGATNRRVGRGLTVHRLVADELREHDSFDAWDASTFAMSAVRDGQVWAVTNQGDDRAVVLDALREPAVQYLETGEGDERLGLFDWSAEPGCEPDDLEAIAQSCPNLHRMDLDALLGQARRAKKAGGQELASWRTEMLCQRVTLLDPAIDPDRWEAGGTDTPLDLADYRDRVACGLEVSLDGSHVSLIAAAIIEGKAHVDVVAAWDSVADMRRGLADVVARVKPRALGWIPSGPTAQAAADLKTARWPRGTELVPISAETTSVCMGLSEFVHAGMVVHPRDPMLDHQVRSAQRLRRGDAYVYGRRGAGPIDGTYALASAVHLARTLPPAKPALIAL